MLHFVFVCFIDSQHKRDIFFNCVNKLIAVMVKYDVLFEVQAEFLNII
jgi:hypothetical protein